MLSQLSKDAGFEKLTKRNIISILTHLLDNNYHFGILCRIDHVQFDPDLTKELKADFRPLTLFFLAGYTFDSAQINKDYLIFEAGFGTENMGSQVSVPLLDIIQIIVDETPIFVNSTAKAEPLAKQKKEIPKTSARESSLEALMANPENKKLLKTRK